MDGGENLAPGRGEFPLLTVRAANPARFPPVLWHNCQGLDLALSLQYARQVPIESRSPQAGFAGDLLLCFHSAEAAVGYLNAISGAPKGPR
jgi:hypothetical protein